MERILRVSYGYLKFTFVVMLASAILFALIGLAIKSPRVCLLVVILGVSAFFMGKSELAAMRKRSDGRKPKPKAETEASTTDSIDQWASFAQAALIVAGTSLPERVGKLTMVVNEWRHTGTLDDIPQIVPPDNAQLEEKEVSLARQIIENYKDDLLRAGFSLSFITKKDTGVTLKPFTQNTLRERVNLIHPFPSVSYIPGNSNIVMGFFVTNTFQLNPEYHISQILKGSFELVKVSSTDTSRQSDATKS